MANQYESPQQGRGITREVGGAPAPAGVWEHPESGQQAITTEDPLFGNAQSQAFKQLGFVYVRPALPAEIKTMPQLAIDSRAADEASMKGLAARLDQLEGVAEQNKALQAEIDKLRQEKVVAETPVVESTPVEETTPVEPVTESSEPVEEVAPATEETVSPESSDVVAETPVVNA